MNPKLTDEAVGALPLSPGREELLEEIIMSTPLHEAGAPGATDARSRRSRWLVPLVAAATVAALATPLWWGEVTTGGTAEPTAVESADPGDSGEAYRVVLDAPGWMLETASVEASSAELTYRRGADQEVSVMWSEEDSYEDYLVDREHITDPPSPGEPIVVLGRDARMWAYGPTDHTMMREPQRGHWAEVRGTGMDRAGYEALLARLRLVDQAGLESTFSGGFVASGAHSEAITEILHGIGSVADPVLPADVAPGSIASDQSDPYHLGADVAGAVACAWLDELRAAHRAGDEDRAAAAATALATSRRWPVLREMADDGGYADVLWGYADQVAAGTVPRGYRQGLGCPS
ncbi:hypothetical protein [Nocardioides sp. zg-DK7169]|uniref:hypothetical protein n=1 Tax=Nocardioides sp. zg-DK7169 TaxID=2736600 RepID=UPI001557BE7A|nr:hypothetical protein [Nocardioides sp. zg-DK7169]NPC97007.1 hypothetical protein [Nocardioides sp. zg-DK7169]